MISACAFNRVVKIVSAVQMRGNNGDYPVTGGQKIVITSRERVLETNQLRSGALKNTNLYEFAVGVDADAVVIYALVDIDTVWR